MNIEDFQTCTRAIFAAFPSAHDRFGKYPTDAQQQSGDGSIVTQGDLLRIWRSTLNDCQLNDVLEAIKQMHRSEDKAPYFDDLPRTIRRIAKKFAAQRSAHNVGRPRLVVDGHAAYACLRCKDTGSFCVWSPESMNAMRDGTFGQPRTLYRVCVRCTCPLGDSFDSMLTFNDRTMVPCCGVGDEDAVAALRKFIGGKSKLLNFG